MPSRPPRSCPASPWPSCRRAAPRTAPASSRPPTSSASDRGRSTRSPSAASWPCRRTRSSSGSLRRTSRPRPVELRLGEERPFDELTHALAEAGYERADTVEERGQFSVRGGLVDIFPSTGREPVRAEFFGDSLERLSAFSAFTQRSLRDLDHVVVHPAAEAAKTGLRPQDCVGRRRGRGAVFRRGSSRRFPSSPARRRSSPGIPRPWERRSTRPSPRPPTCCATRAMLARGYVRAPEARALIDDASALEEMPLGQPASFDAQPPALASFGVAEAENELREPDAGGLPRARVLPAPRRGAPHAPLAAASRGGAPGPRDGGPRRARRGVLRRAAPARVRRARPAPCGAAVGAALPPPRRAWAGADRPGARDGRRPAPRRLRRPRGPRRRAVRPLRHQGGRRRRPRLPLPRVPGRRPPLRAPRPARQGQPLRRRRRPRAGAREARREGVADAQVAGPRSRCASSPAS